jgi:hypothetical protein
MLVVAIIRLVLDVVQPVAAKCQDVVGFVRLVGRDEDFTDITRHYPGIRMCIKVENLDVSLGLNQAVIPLLQ